MCFPGTLTSCVLSCIVGETSCSNTVICRHQKKNIGQTIICSPISISRPRDETILLPSSGLMSLQNPKILCNLFWIHEAQCYTVGSTPTAVQQRNSRPKLPCARRKPGQSQEYRLPLLRRCPIWNLFRRLSVWCKRRLLQSYRERLQLCYRQERGL